MRCFFKSHFGFSTVELFVCIFLFSLILVLVLPLINNEIKRQKDNLYTIQIENIKKGAVSWGAENIYLMPAKNGDSISISLGQLESEGFIKKDITNPKTEKKFSDATLVTISRLNNSFLYNVNNDDQLEIEYDFEAPFIILNGLSTDYIEINGVYHERGAQARDKDGQKITSVSTTITKDGDITPSIDTNTLSTYIITYTATDQTNGKSSSVNRKVIVNDSLAPTIMVNGRSCNHTMLVALGFDFDTLPTTVVDNSDESITPTLIGTVDTNKTGNYELKYEAKDSSNNIGRLMVNVIVKDVGNEIFVNYSVSTTEVTYQDVTITILPVHINPLHSTPYSFDGGNTWQASPSKAFSTNQTVSMRVRDSIGRVSEIVEYSITNIEVENDYVVTKGVNKPKLTQGMTPIKWSGSAWIDTTESDTDWYSYDTTNKKWANARTADGSMWVWIPRYIYKITSGWHVHDVGTIEIQFSQGTNDNWNSAVIGNINTDTTANASNNTWTNHPGFDFGTTKLTGIWVSKFDPTAVEGVANSYVSDNTCPTMGDDVTTKTVKIIPNVATWRCMTANNAFIIARNMEANSVYGWNVASGLQANGTFTNDGNGIDIHLTKNVEWGAIVYLSKSQYGKNTEEIWENPSQTYITGCAGTTATPNARAGCQYDYTTSNGIKTSTTGNIYGIYDIRAIGSKYMVGYVNNSNSSLTTNGLSMINADSKYKQVYPQGSTDTQADNFALTINFKGDALWETSESGAATYSAWYIHYSMMPYTINPFFARGGLGSVTAGPFCYYYTAGITSSTRGFRPILAVATGL